MEKYLVDLFVASAQEQMRAPKALLKAYLALFSPPLGKTLRLDMVKDLLVGQDLRGKRVLDVGCGIGDLSFMLAKRGAEVIGIDLDPQKVKRANAIANKWHFSGLTFLAADVTQLDSMNLGQFDAIFCVALLEHIRDDVALLRIMQHMLRPGGIFVLEVPSARRRTIPEVEAADGHMRPGYLFEETSGLLASTGLRVVYQRTMDPFGLNYYWFVFSRVLPWRKAQRWLFALLAPIFIFCIRLTSTFNKRPGAELCFLAIKSKAD